MKRLVIIFLAIFSTYAVAKPAAKLLVAVNKVYKNNKSQLIRRGASIAVGDTIITSKNAKATLKYNNGTLVMLGANSQYKITSFSPKANKIQLSSEFTKGKMHATTGKQKREHLKTPIIAMAILGTEYMVYVPNSKTTYTKVISGCVQVCDVKYRKCGRVYTAGESFIATPSGVKSAPFPNAGNINIANNNINNLVAINTIQTVIQTTPPLVVLAPGMPIIDIISANPAGI